jgi:hypothetical protein
MSEDGFCPPKDQTAGEQNRRLREAEEKMADAVAERAAVHGQEARYDH